MKYFEIGRYLGIIIFLCCLFSPFIPFLRKRIHNLIKEDEEAIRYKDELYIQYFYRILQTEGISGITEKNIVKITFSYCLVICFSVFVAVVIMFLYPLAIFFLTILVLFYLLSKLKK